MKDAGHKSQGLGAKKRIRKLPKMIIEHNRDADETQYPFTAYLEGTGIVVQATTRDKAIRELMISIEVQLCYDAKVPTPVPPSNPVNKSEFTCVACFDLGRYYGDICPYCG